MTITAARKLVWEHDAQIFRSVFQALAVIDGEKF